MTAALGFLARSRAVALLLVSVVLGPLVGLVVVLVAASLLSRGAAGAASALREAILLALSSEAISLAYVLGFGPAAVSALLGVAAARVLRTPLARLALAPALGALSTAAPLLALRLAISPGRLLEPGHWLGFEAATVLAGAVAALACTAATELLCPARSPAADEPGRGSRIRPAPLPGSPGASKPAA